MLLQPYKHRSDKLFPYSYRINNTEPENHRLPLVQQETVAVHDAIRDAVLMLYSKIKLKPQCLQGQRAASYCKVLLVGAILP